jgi:methyl-accepting chemotaxis protein
MRRLAFSRILVIVALVPTAALALFAMTLVLDGWSRYRELADASSMLRLAVATSRFAGIAVPGEGGAGRDYIAGADHSGLNSRRPVTDELFRALREAAAAADVSDAAINEHLQFINDRMRQIGEFRAKVDARAVPQVESTRFLAPIAAHGIDLVGRIASTVSDAVVSRRILGLYATMQVNEGILLARGFVQRSLFEGQLPTDALLVLARAINLQTGFGALFRDLAPPTVRNAFQAFFDANGKTITDLQAVALKNAGTPAAAAEVTRWNDVNRDLTALLARLVVETGDDFTAQVERMVGAAWRDTLIYLVTSIVTLAAVLLLCRSAVRALRDLLGGLASVMQALGGRSLTVVVPCTDRGDEIGLMARAAEAFRQDLERMTAMEAGQKEAAARASAERAAAKHALADQFEAAVGAIVDKVSSTSAAVAGAASRLSQTAETAQKQSAIVATASEQASANVRAVAAATDQMTSSAGDIGRQVQQSSGIAGEAVAQAQSADTRLSELSRAAARIGDVVKLITAIAEQTNLLALNATIEAARAGDAGRGFAVVAAEVKALATESARATDDIDKQISGMQAATQEVVAVVKDIGATIDRISNISSSVAAAVDQQGSATREIARNVQQASRGTADVATNIADVSRGAGETGSAAAQLLASAEALSQDGADLKREVGRFLAMVRAA